MSGKSTKMSEIRPASKKFSVPVQLTDVSVYHGAFESMKERFDFEMRRLEEEMSKLSTELLRLSGQTTTVHAGVTVSDQQVTATGWDLITKSPLIEEEGEDKILKLQYDLSEYDPNEISVKILNHVLLISAAHQECADGKTAYREFNREFLLPAGTDPESVESSLSKDGVLIIRAPLHIGLAVESDQSVDED